MMTDEQDRPPISTGSLFRTSEGVLVTTLAALTGTVVQGDYAPSTRVTAIAALGLAVACYAISRAISKGSR